MGIRAMRLPAKAWVWFVVVFLGFAAAPIAWGDSTGDLQEVNKKVEPAVVFIKNGNESVGSGFVIDPKGIIATNMHVIDGAKELTVTFPSNKDKKTYKAEGFIEVSRGKDMALIVIKANDGKPFPILKIAEKKPEQGEWVAAFGAPLGLTSTASDGKVSALRTGKDLLDSEMHVKLYQSTGYDPDAEWLQITAPISPGNSGGPLVNSQGEVVGINTWVLPSVMGAQALNFSISTKHLREFVAKAGTNVKPFTSLPKPSFDHGGGGGGGPKGDTNKTLALWKQFNKALNALKEKTDVCDTKLDQIPPLDPRNAASAQNKRNKKISDVYKKYAKAYTEHAGKVRELKNDKTDPELILMVIASAKNCDEISTIYQQIASAVLLQGGSRELEIKSLKLREAMSDFRTHYDILRVNLSSRYSKEFPTLEETANAPDDEAESETAKADDKKGGKADPAKRGELREWTSASGSHKIKAKCIGVENGKVKLQKPDGTVISVTISSLCDEDKEFLGEK